MFFLNYLNICKTARSLTLGCLCGLNLFMSLTCLFGLTLANLLLFPSCSVLCLFPDLVCSALEFFYIIHIIKLIIHAMSCEYIRHINRHHNSFSLAFSRLIFFWGTDLQLHVHVHLRRWGVGRLGGSMYGLYVGFANISFSII